MGWRRLLSSRLKWRDREPRVNMIIHNDISGELITLTVEALDRRHHKAALAPVRLLPTSSEPPGNRIGDLVLSPVRKVSPVTNSMDLFAVARAGTPAHRPIRRRWAPQGRLSAGTPVPLISSHPTLMPPIALTAQNVETPATGCCLC